jgi:oligopeptide/dipeptide ABC transporter ATP-binding protein
MALLEIDDLHLTMRSFDGVAHVLNGVTLAVERGEIWGLVGETGAGKSLTGLSINRLVPTPPGDYTGGAIRFDGVDLLELAEPALRRIRGKRIAMIFQDPTTNLNPSFRIGSQMVDVALHAASAEPGVLGLPAGAGRRQRAAAARALAIRLLDRVGIRNATARIDDFPHQFSGGMRQRVLIAMALIGRPDLLIADEPTTALDVSAQAQILDLLHDLVQEYRLAVVFVTHNLGVVARLCTHTAVLYAGSIVESGPTRDVLDAPLHPYTRGLINSLPTATTERGKLATIGGSMPTLAQAPRGCPFEPRCGEREAVCRKAPPPVREWRLGHRVACIHEAGEA